MKNGKYHLLLTLWIILCSYTGYLSAGAIKWEQIYFDEGAFVISFPSKPIYSKDSTIRSFFSNKTTLLKQFQSQYRGSSYTVGFARMENTVPLNDFYTYGRNGMLANLNATLLLEKDVVIDNELPGREFKARTVVEGDVYVILGRIFYKSGILYNLNVVSPIENQFQSEHEIFLNSFEIR